MKRKAALCALLAACLTFAMFGYFPSEKAPLPPVQSVYAAENTSAKSSVKSLKKLRAEKSVVKDGRTDMTIYVIEPKNSRVYAFTELIEHDFETEIRRTGYVSDKQISKLIKSINEAGAVKKKDGTVITVEVTDKKGKTKSFGEEKGKIVSVLEKFSESKVYYGETRETLYDGINKAVDISVHFRANLGRYADLGKDCSKFAGKGLLIKDVSKISYFKGEDNVMSLPEGISGAAYVKFNKDGTDVLYVNWAESAEYLTKKKLDYDGLEALYLDNGQHAVGSTLITKNERID